MTAAHPEFAAAMEKGMTVSFWARVQPHAPAIIADTGNRTYAELNARCNQLVRALRAHGVGDGDGVALLCWNRTEFVEVFWATRRAGMRLTPINWRLTGEEAAYIANDCDAKAFIADTRFLSVAQYVAASAPRAQARIAIGGAIPGFESYEALLRDQDGADIPDPQLCQAMLYTSGTTGKPKGVHRTSAPPPSPSLVAGADYQPGKSVHLCTGPMYHAAPLSLSMGLPMLYGAAVALMDGWDNERALTLIERHRVTHTHLVPTMMHRLVSLPEAVRKRHDLASLKYVLHGAAPCPPSVKRAMIDWLGPIVHEYYSATEGTGTLVDSPTWLARPPTVGRPDTPDHIRILDEAGNALPPLTAGLIYMKAPASGRFDYYKDDSKTSSAYRGDYYTLGDIGYLDADGYLFLTDRSAHLIICGGVNIYPAEVESTLFTHPAVADVGVIGVEDPEWGEAVKAVVILQPGYTASPQLAAELIDYCRQHIAHYKCPRSVDFVGELPRHDNGKLYKHKLREMYRRRE
ncbi:MAG TPA: AMP-binding protein [Steroidobacteraceae bacterium]|nr:AMP-binding protein [Steroidobacteraceae bacterium]